MDKLSQSPVIILEFLKNLGFSEHESKVFILLHSLGNTTVLELSRKIKIPRSTLYRILEEMKAKGFIIELVEEYKIAYRAIDFDHLKLLVKQQEEKIAKINKLFPMVSSFFDSNKMLVQPATKVYFYRGVEGIRQMVWNVLEAKGEVCGYTYRLLEQFVGEKYMENWRNEFQIRGIRGRDIYSDSYLQSIKNYGRKVNYVGWESRYIKTSVLDIDHQIDIYNDVVGIYNWHDGEVFGIEIHNKKIANLQKQIFKIIWDQAQPEPKK